MDSQYVKIDDSKCGARCTFTLKDGNHHAYICAKAKDSCPYHPNVDISNRISNGYFPWAFLLKEKYLPAGVVKKGRSFKNQATVGANPPDGLPLEDKLPADHPFAATFPKGMINHHGVRLVFLNKKDLDEAIQEDYCNPISFDNETETYTWATLGKREAMLGKRPASKKNVTLTNEEFSNSTPAKSRPQFNRRTGYSKRKQKQDRLQR